MKTLHIYFLSLAILFVSSSDISAQYKKKDEVNLFGFSVMAGMNTTQVDGDFVKGYKKNGLYGGLAGLIRFSKRSQIEVGFIYSQKGSSWGSEENGFKTSSASTLSMDMIEVPITFKYYSKKEGSSVFWEGGFAISQLLERSFDEKFPSNRATAIYNELEPFFNKQELSLVIGLGVRIENLMNVGMRFTTALNHIMDKDLPPVGTVLFSSFREIGILRNYGFTIMATREF